MYMGTYTHCHSIIYMRVKPNHDTLTTMVKMFILPYLWLVTYCRLWTMCPNHHTQSFLQQECQSHWNLLITRCTILLPRISLDNDKGRMQVRIQAHKTIWTEKMPTRLYIHILVILQNYTFFYNNRWHPCDLFHTSLLYIIHWHHPEYKSNTWPGARLTFRGT